MKNFTLNQMLCASILTQINSNTLFTYILAALIYNNYFYPISESLFHCAIDFLRQKLGI